MTFTLNEIKQYIISQDSLGDVLYNLSEENIIKANQPINDENEDEDEDEIYDWRT